LNLFFLIVFGVLVARTSTADFSSTTVAFLVSSFLQPQLSLALIVALASA
jgi:hypothetical protein